jgi:hypothetical protein
VRRPRIIDQRLKTPRIDHLRFEREAIAQRHRLQQRTRGTERAPQTRHRYLQTAYTAMLAAIELLEEHGPSLGRPAVDRIEGSRHHNMKELRSFGGFLRALFAFDPKRPAIVLLGGDKRDEWSGWYERNIPIADDLYDEHLRNLDEEG